MFWRAGKSDVSGRYRAGNAMGCGIGLFPRCFRNNLERRADRLGEATRGLEREAFLSIPAAPILARQRPEDSAVTFISTKPSKRWRRTPWDTFETIDPGSNRARRTYNRHSREKDTAGASRQRLEAKFHPGKPGRASCGW